MVAEIYRLLELSETPRYNIKAVVQQTDVNISTLRAWEQRYGVPHPNRSEHGHRLYSERDIAVIKWLKQCTDNGLAISQAVVMLGELDSSPGVVPSEPPPIASGWSELQTQLLDVLLSADMRQAHALVNTVCMMHPLERVVMELFCPILVEIGERWAQGTVVVAEERMVTSFVRQRLLSLIQLHAPFAQGPRLICACAPDEHHEVGLLSFAFLMQQRGWEVIYLGTSMASEEVQDFLLGLSPALVSFSASLIERVGAMLQVCEQVGALKQQGLEVCYGGRVFSQYPELVNRFPGIFLGNDLPRAVELADRMGETIDSERWHNASRVTYRTNGVSHLTTVQKRRAHGA